MLLVKSAYEGFHELINHSILTEKLSTETTNVHINVF